jgi:hypothetical protein
MTYRDILARSERLRPDGTPVWPLGFRDRPRTIEARQGGDAHAAPSRSDESVARQGAAPLYSKDHPHA